MTVETSVPTGAGCVVGATAASPLPETCVPLPLPECSSPAPSSPEVLRPDDPVPDVSPDPEPEPLELESSESPEPEVPEFEPEPLEPEFPSEPESPEPEPLEPERCEVEVPFPWPERSLDEPSAPTVRAV